MMTFVWGERLFGFSPRKILCTKEVGVCRLLCI